MDLPRHTKGSIITKIVPNWLLIKQLQCNYFKPILWLRLSLLNLRGLSQGLMVLNKDIYRWINLLFVSWFCMFAGWKDEGLLPLGYGVSDRDKDNNGSPCGSWGLYIFQWKSNKFRKIPITWSSKEVRACNTWILSNETSRLWKKNISKIGHKTHWNTLRISGE